MKNKYIDEEKFSKHKKVMRILGFIFAPAGLIMIIISFISFFSSFGTTNFPNLFYLFFIGAPLLFIGSTLLSLSYMRKFAEYSATEISKVSKDVSNYMESETRDEKVETVKQAFDAIKGKDEKKDTLVCHYCGCENDEASKYCKYCGKELSNKKTCSKCGQTNDIDSYFCSKCGNKLD